jgi:hypothetical protein
LAPISLMDNPILSVGAIFPSFEELETVIRSLALGQGAEVIRASFNHDGEGPRSGCFKCSKAGAPRTKGEEQVSRKCGCPWFVRFCRNANATYRVTALSLEHNHSELNGADNRSIYKRLNEGDLDKIQKFRELNVPIPVIIRMMTMQGVTVRADELYGIIKREPDEILALIRHLSSSPEYIVRSYVDIEASDTRTLKALFFTKNSQLLLFRKCPKMVILDCTYSTTTTNMPLCVLVGIDHNNSTFIIGISLLIHETTDYYMWTLNSLLGTSQIRPSAIKTILSDFDKALVTAIEVVVPFAAHHLCTWHLFFQEVQRPNVP